MCGMRESGKMIFKSRFGGEIAFIPYAGRGKRISRKRGQGIRKLTPKNVRVHRESALHLALSKEWISRTSLTAPKLFAS